MQTKAQAAAAVAAKVAADAKAALVASAAKGKRKPAAPAAPRAPLPQPAKGRRFAYMAPEVAADEYAAHPLTKRHENGSLVPQVAKAGRRIEPKAPPVGKARAYKRGSTPNEAREGTYRKYMLDIVLACTDTVSAQNMYNAAPWPDGRPLCNTHCFNWAVREGYIAWVD
jgi:hypothetical protein